VRETETPAAVQVRTSSLFLEGLAVLLGVLAAFGVDALWQMRSERVRERAFLTALQEELASNRERCQDYIEYLQGDAAEAAELYRSVVLATEPVGEERVLELLLTTGPAQVFLEQAALLDLVGSGGLQLVRSAPVRRGVASYERRLRDAQHSQEKLDRFWSEELTAYGRVHGSLPAVFSRLDGLFGEELFEGLFRAEDFPLDEEAFRGNRTYANLYATWFYHRMVTAREYERLAEVMEELGEALGGALG
jgi:hypothetical protein